MLSEFFSIFNPLFFGLTAMLTVIKFIKIYESTGIKIPLKFFLSLLILSLPDVTLVILPISFLISIAISLTKLSSTTELVAIQNAGIAPQRILKIFTILAFSFTVINLIISIFLKPYCNFIIRKNIDAAIQGKVFVLPRPGEFKKLFNDTYFYADSSDKKLEGVIFFQPKNGIEIQMITAKNGEIIKKENINIFHLNNGSYLKIESDNVKIMKFENLFFNPFSLSEKSDEFDVNRGAIPTFILIQKFSDKSITYAQKSEFFYRIFFPFSVVIFLFLSFPLSWRHGRSYKTRGILISIIVSFVYYIAFSTVNALSTRGIIHPAIGMGTITFTLIVLGILVCHKKLQRV